MRGEEIIDNVTRAYTEVGRRCHNIELWGEYENKKIDSAIIKSKEAIEDLEYKLREATEALGYIDDELQCSGKRYLLHFIKETLETIQ